MTAHLRRSRAPLVFLLLAGPALARGEGKAEVEQSPEARVELRADLQSLFHFRNDSDFDRSPPLYDESGQTVGAFATIFTPRISLRILERLRIYYEVELGLNYWSKQNPDQQDPLAADIFVLKHREIFGEGELGSGGFKVGYAHLRDPTGLFLAHWIGVAQGWIGLGEGAGRLGLFLGQVPDQTYEGILLDDNNFKRDIWVGGARYDLFALSERWRLCAAVTALVDTHLPEQARWVVAPSIHADLLLEGVAGYLDLALQAGRQRGQAAGGADQTIVAWAAQGGVTLTKLGWLRLEANLLALSPDDAYDGNRRNHGFLYSGKSRSATLMLSEDELRDWYDNLDERASSFSGGFFINRAGWLVGDVKATLTLNERVRPALVVGAASVLKPNNALDRAFVGAEIDALLELGISDYLVGQVVVGALVPGGAAAALFNHINRQAKDPVVMTELSLVLRY